MVFNCRVLRMQMSLQPWGFVVSTNLLYFVYFLYNWCFINSLYLVIKNETELCELSWYFTNSNDSIIIICNMLYFVLGGQQKEVWYVKISEMPQITNSRLVRNLKRAKDESKVRSKIINKSYANPCRVEKNLRLPVWYHLV